MQPSKNLFTSYTFTPSEELQAPILPLLTEAWIQNKIAQLATNKVTITYDPEHPLKFQQEEAELQGQIKILQLLINESEEAKAILTEMQTKE